MPIAAGIAFIVLGAVLTFALTGGHIGDLDLHAVGVILMLAGTIGILLPALIRNRSRFSRPTIRSRQDVMDDGTRTIVNHTDGSQTLVEHNDGEQTFAEHAGVTREHTESGMTFADTQITGSRSWAGCR